MSFLFCGLTALTANPHSLFCHQSVWQPTPAAMTPEFFPYHLQIGLLSIGNHDQFPSALPGLLEREIPRTSVHCQPTVPLTQHLLSQI